MLKQSIKSILQQTYQNFEIVVINDGGQDIAEIVEDPRIVYLQHAKSKGPAAARNLGLEAAKGNYIAYLDDDDSYLTNHLETLHDKIHTSDYGLVYSRCVQKTLSEDAKVIKVTPSYGIPFNIDTLLVINITPTLCVLHKKECIDKVGYFDTTLTTHEDWDLWIRIALKYPVCYVPTLTCTYTRKVNSSLTFTDRRDFDKTRKVLYNKYREYASPEVRKLQEKQI